MRVGMFDSGIGGLTILNQFLKIHPNNEYIYYGDTKNMPYGSKSKEELLNIGRNVINFLISKKVDIIIVACGTLSSNVYEELKKEYNIPIYDIIRPVIEELKETNIKRVLLLGTEKTIESKKFENKIKNAGIHVDAKACPKFAPILEGKVKDDINIVIQDYLYDYKGMNLDCIIPGCTHYHLLNKEISDYMEVKTLNIGEILTRRIPIKYSISGLELYFNVVTSETEKNINNIIGDCEIKKP